MRSFLMLVKREFWECRASFVRAPLALFATLAVLLLLGMAPFQNPIGELIKSAWLMQSDQIMLTTQYPDFPKSQMDARSVGEYMLHGLVGLYSVFVLVLLFVQIFYFADALYGDRRDQSILFWKSLPVPERDTVLAKIVAGAAGAPMIYVSAAFITGVFFVLIFSLYAKLSWGLPLPTPGWAIATLFGNTVGLVLGWFFLVLWLFPIICWLLLCSAAARKAPLLIALGIPAGLVLLEVSIFGTRNLFDMFIQQTIAGLHCLQQLTYHPESIVDSALGTFSSARLWVGLITSTCFLMACVWLRNNRWEI